MSQQEEARRALDELLDEFAGAQCSAWEMNGPVADAHKAREAIHEHVRALTATAPQTQPEPYAWAVEMGRDEISVDAVMAFNIDAARERARLYRGARIIPLYRGAAPQQWQPMPDAPRDGTEILAAIFVYHNGEPFGWERHVIAADDETGQVAADYDRGWQWEDYSHWMPLPAAPQVQETDK